MPKTIAMMMFVATVAVGIMATTYVVGGPKDTAAVERVVSSLRQSYAQALMKYGPDDPRVEILKEQLNRLGEDVGAYARWNDEELRLVVAELLAEVRLLRKRIALLENPPVITLPVN